MRGKLPRHLLVPDVEQFDHGMWVTHDSKAKKVEDISELDHVASMADSGEEISLDDVRKLRYSCGTQGCLVGWAALAFGEPGVFPGVLQNPATADFLNKMVELSGIEPVSRSNFDVESDYIYESAFHASSVFEGDGFGKVGLSAEEARRLWMKAGDHFGYDTQNLLE